MNFVPYVIEKTSNGERSYDIYSRLLKDIDSDYSGSYSSHWCKTLEEAEAKIFKRTANLDCDVMAYKAYIKKDGVTVAEWGNDVGNL